MSLEPPIVLTGELTPDDVRRAWRLAEGVGTKWWIVPLAIVLATILVVGLLIGWSAREFDAAAGDRILFFVCSAAVVPPLVVGGFRLRNRALFRRAWRTKTGWFTPVETTLDETGLTSTMPHASSRYGWPLFERVRLAPGLIVLFMAEGGWMFFARSRFGSDEEWERFVAFVESRDWSAGPTITERT